MRTMGCRGLVLSACVSGLPIACGNGAPSTNIGVGTNGGTVSIGSLGGNANAGGHTGVSSSALGGSGAVSSNTSVGGNAPATAHVDISGNTSPTEVECAQNQVPIEILPPEIMIVMDRSMSMTDDENGNPCTGSSATTGNGNCGTISKWHQTIEALKAIVNDTQTSVSWGMFWLGDEPTECGASKTPIVPITPRESYAPIQQALDGNAFEGKLGTPTAQAVNNAVAYMKKLTDPNPKFLLVATDGEPNCGGGRLNTVDSNGATAAVEAAAKTGIPAFVVGIATTSLPTATSALNAMAVAGGRAQTGAATDYYAVSDTESLKTTLKQIVDLASSCTISLENAPKGEWKIAISATDSSGKPVLIPDNDADGWNYTDPSSKSSITLVGSACENLKSGKYSNVQFVYTCPGRDIVL